MLLGNSGMTAGEWKGQRQLLYEPQVAQSLLQPGNDHCSIGLTGKDARHPLRCQVFLQASLILTRPVTEGKHSKGSLIFRGSGNIHTSVKDCHYIGLLQHCPAHVHSWGMGQFDEQSLFDIVRLIGHVYNI
ncbi:hypothetical protein E2C01_007204 [Portunus trituberculatus]|uniref:Uncharacterized protein n=1 Tax=Portunus trituberculatus TaxID=210409 RepID=A0A5B7CX79_PORTR|nr:hypothetical protein [Portunus trituberculatus]